MKIKLTNRQKEILDSLKYGGVEWYTPMMVGGFSSSWHSQVLNQLVRKDLVECRLRNTLLNNLYPHRSRASYEYRLKPQS